MNKNITILVFLGLMSAAAIFSIYSYSNLEKEKKDKQAALDKLEETRKINEILKQKSDSLTKVLLSAEDSTGHKSDSKWNTEKTTLIRELKNVNETYTKINDLSAYQKAYILEKEGFEALVSNNFDLALEKISAAEKTSPNFHMCYEISNLLISNRKQFNDPEIQKNVKIQIIEKFSWKAPADPLSKLKEQVKLPPDRIKPQIKNTVKWPVKKGN